MPENLPRRPLARQTEDQPEYAPWDDPFCSPDPSPALQARAERGWEKFLRLAGRALAEDGKA
ncbi:hypothetical protein [Streptomyces sp. NBC_00207]|uniref:hypothetical protein n=1 Tax=unclassified Streptomyces TaxID=2593676 RepID=UPI0028863417|nr:hypothetical protein [Streptomyces sp. DSM 41633]